MDGAMAIRRGAPSAATVGLGALAVLVGTLSLNGFAQPVGPATATEARVAQLPLSFEPNAGRANRAVDYIAHSVSGGTLHLSGHEATLALGERTLRLRFAGAATDPRAIGLDRLPGEANSFIGDDPSRWRTDLPTYSAVRYRSLYPGIDADFYGSQRDLEYDFRLAPHADPSRIALRVAGGDSIELAPSGDLEIALGKHEVIQRAPVAYQWIDGERHPVESSYLLAGSRVGIDLGPYDRSRPLVIDPTLVYSTYLGGSGADAAFAIAVDSSGAAYVTGNTDSADFPTQGQFQTDQTGSDAFVSKLNPAGTGLEYSTYLGGGGGAAPTDQANGIAVDSSGAAYVTGNTNSTDFPTEDEAQPDQAGFDAFLTKLAPSGAALDYSTYLGGDSFDSANAVAIDSSGGAYVAGTTLSNDFPNPDAFQDTKGGTGDAFVARFNPHPGPGAVTLGYSTYLGGAGSGFVESAAGIAVDSSGAAYVTGATDTTDFPTTPGPLQGNQPGPDGFVTKLSPDSAADETLVYSTYLGGNGADAGPVEFEEGFAIAVDSGGSAYVTGRTDSSDFPTQAQFQGNQPMTDVFVTKLNQAGNGIAYSTYLGGSQNDWGYGIAVDQSGNAFVTGITGSSDFPQQNPIQPDAPTDDIFVTQLNPAGDALGYSTLIGGNGIDWGRGIALDGSGNAYFAGFSQSTDFPHRAASRAGDDPLDSAVTGEVSPSGEEPPPQFCSNLALKKIAFKKNEVEGDSIVRHYDSGLVFSGRVSTTGRCIVTVSETEESLANFDFLSPTSLTEPVGDGTTVTTERDFTFVARPKRVGRLINVLRLSGDGIEERFSAIEVLVYDDDTDIKTAAKREFGGNAVANGEAGHERPAARADDLPGEAIDKVEVAVLRKPKGAEPLAKARCEWLTKKGGFKSVKPSDEGTCDEPVWIKAKLDRVRKGKTPWSYEPKRDLPEGKYIAYSRATNKAKVSEAAFSRQDRNEKKFTVKR
jgi:hypothetical protein